ncbi:MAG: hypothetical protein K2Q26_10255 [Bdellovibrionales bacterium]|nr:hypothetical protein [Bdellovibrionales bacterium]
MNGSLGVGFKLSGFDTSCASPESLNSFCQKIENFLVGLPENLRLQVFYRMTNNAYDTISEHEKISENCDPAFIPIREARLKFLDQKIENAQFFVPEIYVFVRSEALQLKKRRFWEKRAEFEGFPKKEFEEHKAKFQILASQVEAALRSSQLHPHGLSQDEWYGLCFSYFNFERSELIGTPKLRDPFTGINPSLPAQLALTDFSVSEKHLESGNLFYRAVTLALLPENETFPSMIESLTKLNFHYWISQNIKTLDQRKEIEKLELLRRIASSMASGSQNVSDIESESKLSSLEDILRDVMAGSERLIASDVNIIFWAESRDELERKTEEILQAFRSMGQAEGLVETFALEDVFFKAAPSVCEGFRHKRMKTSNCAHLMPLYAPLERL